MESIADIFQSQLDDLKRRSDITDNKVASTIARCHKLIAEQEAAEAQWIKEHPELQ